MRSSGILLHITSLPSPYGIGTLGKESYDFIDFLEKSEQTYWQILPIGPTSYYDSPYQTFSIFAGNPYFIDLLYLTDLGLLLHDELNIVVIDPQKIDYKQQFDLRVKILEKAFTRFQTDSREYREFKTINRFWLDDYALFMAIKDYYLGASWQEWPSNIKKRTSGTIEYYKKRLKQKVEFHCFIQYVFFIQWYALKKYAATKGIKIIGDLPIYVSLDSSDVWTKPAIFDLNNDLKPNYVAGVPPDGFSEDGQVWGNPLYRWDLMETDGYSWWVERMKYSLNLFDCIRIDHFIGFENYFCINSQEKTAKNGFWQKGPGIKVFKKIKEALGQQNIIAEDLGNVTSDVKLLLKETGFPGMKVLQFAFNVNEESDYLPHKYTKNSVVYTGTHDNETTLSWFEQLNENDLSFCLNYINNNGGEKVQSLIKVALASIADTAIIPYQDYLALGNEARMNVPSTIGNNWQWRTVKSDFSNEISDKIRILTVLYGRKKQ